MDVSLYFYWDSNFSQSIFRFLTLKEYPKRRKHICLDETEIINFLTDLTSTKSTASFPFCKENEFGDFMMDSS